MRTAVIVQARMGSTRLPGKVTRDLAGKPVLEHVLERCGLIPGIDAVVCAIADEPDAAILADLARRAGAEIHVGPVQDVLARYRDAARTVAADIVMRVTSDCPLIDPAICGQVLQLRRSAKADYASNVWPRSYPKGLDCEVFTGALLERAALAATVPFDREHVTQWMVRASGVSTANLSSGTPALAEHRWTLDYPQDLDFLRAVLAHFPARMPAMADVLGLLAERPDLQAINAGLPEPPAPRNIQVANP